MIQVILLMKDDFRIINLQKKQIIDMTWNKINEKNGVVTLVCLGGGKYKNYIAGSYVNKELYGDIYVIRTSGSSFLQPNGIDIDMICDICQQQKQFTSQMDDGLLDKFNTLNIGTSHEMKYYDCSDDDMYYDELEMYYDKLL